LFLVATQEILPIADNGKCMGMNTPIGKPKEIFMIGRYR